MKTWSLNNIFTDSNRGQKLVDFALGHKLTIINTCFKKKPNRKWTWRSPNELHKNEIDYILTNQPKLFTNFEVLNLNYPSDDHVIRGTVKLSKQKISRIQFTNKLECQLKSEEERIKYKVNLKILLSEPAFCQENATVQTCYNKIRNAIVESLKSAQINKKKPEHKIIQERTEKLLLQRKKNLQKTKNKTRSMKNELSALYKLVNKYIKQDYSKYRQDTIKRHLQICGSTKKSFKELRTNNSWIKGLKNRDKYINKRSDVVNTATEFYRNLYSDISQNHITTSYRNKDRQSEDFKEINETEVIETIKKLKLKKIPGSDNITNEALKIAQKILAAPLSKLFNLILQNSETPTQWSEAMIILIYKKGDPKNIDNYRPISLLPSLYKLFSTVINRRISSILETKQPVEQVGFRKEATFWSYGSLLSELVSEYSCSGSLGSLRSQT
ncbi:unnamed protein product [Euphydryas editha]|uniref:Reverse transcriptase domain-containing protein n=1 Tax=Euphydryas editha TaxID=104508 RepID=A0AAU9TDR7_EUPED|nr:unnamed protein product [Euphydryas editha]